MSLRCAIGPVEVARGLLAAAGLPPLDAVEPLSGGRNNRVWKVVCGSQRFLLKQYFWSQQDQRDRQGQEWAFLRFLQEIDCSLAPAPLARNIDERYSLLEFIEGVPPEGTLVNADDVNAALEFFRQMNAARLTGTLLPPVSEACFSIDEHLATTAGRVRRLANVPPVSEVHVRVGKFVAEMILPLWAGIHARVCVLAGKRISRVLPPGERCLSPSDFGFHNALREEGGSLRFVDFEYAGWDDPAKTIIDFCNQPDLLLPETAAEIFREGVLKIFSSSGWLPERLRLLEPVYKLKWSCICLNGFLPGSAAFSLPGRSAEGQFFRARAMADRATESLDLLAGSL